MRPNLPNPLPPQGSAARKPTPGAQPRRTLIALAGGTLALLAIGAVIFLRTRPPPVAPAPPPPTGVKVSFESTPPGAAIELDGKPTQESTPAVLEVPPMSEHQVRYSLGGYEDWTGSFVAIADGQTITRGLEAKFFIEVESDPPGARVLLAGAVVLPQTPGTFETHPGKTALRVEKEGFMPAQVEPPVTLGRAKVNVVLVPSALLKVSANLAGAAIWVDGVDTGLTAPAEVPVAAGLPHQVLGRQGIDRSKPVKTRALKAGASAKVVLKIVDSDRAASSKDQARLRSRIKALKKEKAGLDLRMAKTFATDSGSYGKAKRRADEIEEELEALQNELESEY